MELNFALVLSPFSHAYSLLWLKIFVKNHASYRHSIIRNQHKRVDIWFSNELQHGIQVNLSEIMKHTLLLCLLESSCLSHASL